MLAAQLNQPEGSHNKTQPLRINLQAQNKRQAKLLNETLKSLRGRLVEGLNKDIIRPCMKEQSCNTEHPLPMAKPAVSMTSQSLQTEEYLMYQMVQNQLKHVYDNVNKMKADDTALKEKHRLAKNELKTEKSAKEVLEKQLQKHRNEAQLKEKEHEHLQRSMKIQLEQLQKSNAELVRLRVQHQSEVDKCQKNLMSAEFKLLKLQEELENAKAQAEAEKKVMESKQQTELDSFRVAQPTILESDDQTNTEVDKLHVLQMQLADQVQSLSERVQTLNLELTRSKATETGFKEQLAVESQTVRALQNELKNYVQELSAYEFDRGQLLIKYQKASSQLQMIRQQTQRQERQFADVMQCFVQEKTSFIESKKRQVEQQFIEMERSYRILFEQNIELKKQLSESRNTIETIKRSFQEKECQFNLEVSAYQKRLHEEALKRCSDCERAKARQGITTARNTEDRAAMEKHLFELNTVYARTKEELQRAKDLNDKLEKEATEKLKHLASRYEQLIQYNELLLAENMELKKNKHGHSSTSKENERMRKLYISIWKDRFSSV